MLQAKLNYRIVLTADRTLMRMTVLVGVIRRFAPLMLHHFAVFSLAFGAFCQSSALCGPSAVRNNGIVDAANLTLVRVTGCILIIPRTSKAVLGKLAVVFTAVLADRAVFAGCLAASMLELFDLTPRVYVGNFLSALGILKIFAAFWTEVVCLFACFLAGSIDLVHLQRRMLVFRYLGEGVIKRNFLIGA